MFSSLYTHNSQQQLENIGIIRESEYSTLFRYRNNVDLLLYHRRLRCLVAIELKIGKFQPEYVGKMQFYLAALDSQVKEISEMPSLGIILCKEKKRTVVEYALKLSRTPISVANYRITSTLPKELRKELPSPTQIRQLLAEI